MVFGRKMRVEGGGGRALKINSLIFKRTEGFFVLASLPTTPGKNKT